MPDAAMIPLRAAAIRISLPGTGSFRFPVLLRVDDPA
jgi:hypothetical protein